MDTTVPLTARQQALLNHVNRVGTYCDQLPSIDLHDAKRLARMGLVTLELFTVRGLSWKVRSLQPATGR